MSKFNFSKQISSQDELNQMILALSRSISATHASIAILHKKFPSVKVACNLLHDILNFAEYDNPSLANYQCLPNDFDIYQFTGIDREFFDNFVVRRLKLLRQNLCDLPNNHDPLTWNMIQFCGRTIANRIYEKCNDVKGFKAASLRPELSNIIRDVFLTIHIKNHPELLDLLAYSIVLMCKSSDVVLVDESLYDKVQRIESIHGNNVPHFTEDDFPPLSK